MLPFGRTAWECVECGRALEPGDKACPTCGSTEARRRQIALTHRMSHWSVLAWVAFLFALGALAFLVASHFAPEPSPSGEIVRHFRQAQELLREERYDDAVAELETVTRLARDSVGGHHELARAYDAVGRHADALREMRMTLRLTMTDETAREPTRESEEADLRFELATLLAKNGEFAEAVGELQKAARLDQSLDGSLEYHIAYGIAQAGRGRADSGRQALATALEMSPKMTRDALESWIADRPIGPEAPLLQRVLLETAPPREPSPPAESPPIAPDSE